MEISEAAALGLALFVVLLKELLPVELEGLEAVGGLAGGVVGVCGRLPAPLRLLLQTPQTTQDTSKAIVAQ